MISSVVCYVEMFYDYLILGYVPQTCVSLQSSPLQPPPDRSLWDQHKPHQKLLFRGYCNAVEHPCAPTTGGRVPLYELTPSYGHLPSKGCNEL